MQFWQILVQLRRGRWDHQAAVFKVWNLSDSLGPLFSLQSEKRTYDRLTSLQASLALLQAPLPLLFQS